MNNSSNSVLPVVPGTASAIDARRSALPRSDTSDGADQSWSRAVQAAAPKGSADSEPAPVAPGEAGHGQAPGQDSERQQPITGASIWTRSPGPGPEHADRLSARLGAPEQPGEAELAAVDRDATLNTAASAFATDVPALRAEGDAGALAQAEIMLERRGNDAAGDLRSTLPEPDDEALGLPAAQVVAPMPVDATQPQQARSRADSPSSPELRDDGGAGSQAPLDQTTALAVIAQGAVSDPLRRAYGADALSRSALPEPPVGGSPAGSGQPDPADGTSTTSRLPAADSRSSLLTAGPPPVADRPSGAQDAGREARLPGATARAEPALMPASAAQLQPATSSPATMLSTGDARLSAALSRAGSSQSAATGLRVPGAALGTAQLDQRGADPDIRGALRGNADPDQLLQSLARDAATAFELKPATAGGSSNLQSLALSPATVTAEGTPVSPATPGNVSAPSATPAATAAASGAASPQQLALALGDARELGQELGRLLSRGQLDGQRSLSVTLYPEELGRLDIRVASAGEQGVAVSIQTQLPQVRDLLEAQVGRLRAALGEGGFTEVEVDLGERASERDSSERRSSEQDATARQQASGTSAMPEARADDSLTHASPATATAVRAPGFNAYA